MKTLTKWQQTEVWQNGHYNPSQAVELTYNRKRQEIVIQAGSRDYVDVFKEDDSLYVLSYNYGMGYVGLERFDLSDEGILEQVSDVFLQNHSDVDEILGKQGLDLAPMTMCKRLQPYVDSF